MKGIKAKVTIIDEENGLVLAEDKLIAPYREDFDPGCRVTDYEFRFRFKHMEYSPPLFEAEQCNAFRIFLDRMANEMEGCHSCKYGENFDIEKEPCKYCYGLSLYTKKEVKNEQKPNS